MILEKKTIEDVLNQSENIICFGSGKAFDKLMEIFEDTDLIEKILYIVENNSAKWGRKKKVNRREIEIVSPQYFVAQNKDRVTALITLRAKEEILKQYEDVEDCKSLHAVWHSDIMREYCTRKFDEAKTAILLCRSKYMLIPKVIHYCWFGKGEIPYKNRAWMESWEKYCPDYKILQWNEDNYDVTKNRYMLEAYRAKRWGFATDYARLDIIYQYGGIYLDTDVELIKSLDELLYQPAFMGWEDGLRVNTGLGFGAVRGMDLFREMRDYYDGISFIQEDGSQDLTACPTFQTKVLQKHGLKRNGEYQIVGNIAVLPVTYLCGKPSYVLHDTRTEYTFGIHQFQGSWIKVMEKK